MNEPVRPTGFRPLRVTARVAETDRVTSFWLEPVDADGWRPFLAGQFLSFRLPSTDARGKMLRNYSLASAPGDTGRYRICVKRDSASSGTTGGQALTEGQSSTGGQGSGYFHDAVAVGDVLHANGPSGNFILKPESERPVVFISGDIGITPMVSMLADCAARSRRPLHFIHECDGPEYHIMRRDIEAIAAQRSGVTLRTFYRAAQAGGTRAAGVIAGE
ncbi:MAG: FAD-binding oxidoreductase, partial [Beijerinckiaceae bacterium]